MANYPGITVNCWDRPRSSGPCCMNCIIEETNRRAGCDVPETIESLGLVDPIISAITLTVRACCHHQPWLSEVITQNLEHRDD